MIGMIRAKEVNTIEKHIFGFRDILTQMTTLSVLYQQVWSVISRSQRPLRWTMEESVIVTRAV